MLRAISNNKVSFILLFTVIMGLSYDFIDWPEGKIHSHSISWFAWFVMHYIIGLLLLLCIVLKKSEIDYYMLYSYMVFDAYSMYSYIMHGWPEPKNDIITGFALVVVFLVGRKIYIDERRD